MLLYSVTFFLKLPPRIPVPILYMMTVPPLVTMAVTLWRPSSILPSSVSRDWLLLPPALVALSVFILHGGMQDPRFIFHLRVWSWWIPVAVLGMARELEQSLQEGVTQASRMSQLLYNSPGA